MAHVVKRVAGMKPGDMNVSIPRIANAGIVVPCEAIDGVNDDEMTAFRLPTHKDDDRFFV